MAAYLWIAVGSAVGGVARFWFSGFIAQRFGETFPWGTLIVNVTGSFIIGLFATLTAPDGRHWLVHANSRFFFMAGICGGYTTFSSFSLQTLDLARDGDYFSSKPPPTRRGFTRAMFDCRLARPHCFRC